MKKYRLVILASLSLLSYNAGLAQSAPINNTIKCAFPVNTNTTDSLEYYFDFTSSQEGKMKISKFEKVLNQIWIAGEAKWDQSTTAYRIFIQPDDLISIDRQTGQAIYSFGYNKTRLVGSCEKVSINVKF
jgi:hypothetical protein